MSKYYLQLIKVVETLNIWIKNLLIKNKTIRHILLSINSNNNYYKIVIIILILIIKIMKIKLILIMSKVIISQNKNLFLAMNKQLMKKILILSIIIVIMILNKIINICKTF